MAQKTRADLIVSIAQQMGHYATGTATSGSTSMLIDLKESYAPDGHWLNHYLYILTDAGGSSAAPEGEESLVTGYVQTTGKLTIDPVLSAAIAAEDIYQLLPVRRADIIAAINLAISLAGQTWLVSEVDDSTITIAASDYDYTLPTNLVRLLTVYTRDETSDPWRKVGGQQWRVAKTPGGQELVLSTLNGLANGDLVRLAFLSRPAALSTDAGTLGLGEPAETEMVAYIVAMALALLNEQAASATPLDEVLKARLALAQLYHRQAAEIKQAAPVFHPAATAKTRRVARSR